MMDNACTQLFSRGPADIILFVLAIIILIVFIGFLRAAFRAIFLFIFSKGDDKKVKDARNSIRYMIIGLFLTVMLLFLGPTLLRMFKLQGSDNFSVKDVFQKSQQIVSCVLTGISAVVNDYPNNNPFGSTADPFGTTASTSSSTTTSEGLRMYDL